MRETPGSISGLGVPLEKSVATHSSVLAWRIPWTEERGGLQSMGSKEWDTTEQLTLSNTLSEHLRHNCPSVYIVPCKGEQMQAGCVEPEMV